MPRQTTYNIVAVGSANVHLGDALPAHARESIQRVASKYFGHMSSASVHIGREGNDYRCTVIMQMGGLPMRSQEQGHLWRLRCGSDQGRQAAPPGEAGIA
jgi:ribosome-associated translation inhibitor RaiA